MSDTLKIGTRGSPLALAQARETRSRLMKSLGREEEQFEIVVIKTTGDLVRDRPLSEIGGKGLFTKELEEALLAGSIDLAVHSMKDVPAHLPDPLVIGAILPREDVRDAFLSFAAKDLRSLPKGARLGSSSVRRVAQALNLRPDLVPGQFRGNVETRIQKLKDGVADATFLAAAGLKRLGLQAHITSFIEIDDMMPALAQGAVGLEIAKGSKAAELIAKIDHAESHHAVLCERAFMAALDGSCRTPIAGHAVLKDGSISFRGEALTLDGKHVFKAARGGTIADAARLGKDAGEEVRKNGGSRLTL